MIVIRVHSGRVGGVMFVQFAPPSREMCSSPSSEPAQKRPDSCGDSQKAKIVQKISAPLLSEVIRPLETSFAGSLRVRSGLIVSQECPSSVERWRCCEAA